MIFLGLTFGKIECGDSTDRSGSVAKSLFGAVAINKVIDCASAGDVCVEPKDIAWALIPLAMSCSSSEKVRTGADFFALVNMGRICYNSGKIFLSRCKNLNAAIKNDVATQTDTKIIAGPFHSKDERECVVDVTVPQFKPIN